MFLQCFGVTLKLLWKFAVITSILKCWQFHSPPPPPPKVHSKASFLLEDFILKHLWGKLPYTLPFVALMGMISLSCRLFAADTKHCQGRMAPGDRNDDTTNQAVSLHLLFLMAPILLFGFFKNSETAFHSQPNCPATSLVLSCFLVPFIFFFPTLSSQHLVISISFS